MKTNNLNIQLLYSNQAKKEISINEALVKLDSLLNAGAISMQLSSPPSSPKDGDLYIVGKSPNGLWAKYEDYITYYYHSWYFIQPKTGSLMWVNDQRNLFYYSDGSWNAYSVK